MSTIHRLVGTRPTGGSTSRPSSSPLRMVRVRSGVPEVTCYVQDKTLEPLVTHLGRRGRKGPVASIDFMRGSDDGPVVLSVSRSVSPTNPSPQPRRLKPHGLYFDPFVQSHP